jgi:hypothetical protein
VKKWKSEKFLTLALKSFLLIYKSSNFSKYFGVDAITILIVPKEQSFNIDIDIRGGSRGAHSERAPLKLEKNWFFGVKSWFFTRNTPKMFAPFSAPLTSNPGSAPGYRRNYSEVFFFRSGIKDIPENNV